MDILPTFIEAAGGVVPDNLDGKSLVDIIKGNSEEAVHDHLVWAGLHSRAWGFMINKSFKNHGNERNYAPPAWVVIKDDYMLRYTGEIVPDLNIESPEGKPPTMELFNFEKDKREKTDISVEFPEKVDELREIYRKESVNFKPPVSWSRAKWEELNSEILQ